MEQFITLILLTLFVVIPFAIFMNIPGGCLILLPFPLLILFFNEKIVYYARKIAKKIVK